MISAIITALVGTVLYKQHRQFDLLLLGREQATSLGLEVNSLIKRNLAFIAILVAVSTSLLGPTAFMGIFVGNVAHALSRNTRHKQLFKYGISIAIAAFLVAQFLVEHAFNYRMTAGILVNLLCAIYFFVLILRPRSPL